MWGVIFGVAGVLVVAAAVFLWTRFCKFGIVRKLAGDRKWLRRGIGLIPILCFVIFFLLDMVDTAIVMIHMSFCWAIAELVAWIVRKIRKTGKPVSNETGWRPYITGIVVLVIELCYFSAGWVLAHGVWETDYRVKTAKDIGEGTLRIAQISDSHVGTTFDGEGFAEHMKTVWGTHPDVLVITGDFVDDDTTREDMIRSCRALGEFQCPYGVYFVFGNHDRGYRNYRDFSGADLEAELLKNNVHIMRDEVELVGDRFYLVGRKDRSEKGRVEIDKILSLLDPSKYIVVLDHQPTDFDAEAAAGADLVLCGHTHGGQMLEINLVGTLIGANDRNYGIETRGNTTFIVSSGISDWRIGFKTGTKSEFCVIDVVRE